MKGPLISIILPVYNIEEYLNKCIDSLFKQTYTNIELVIVDDGSSDICSKLCDSYVELDDRVKVFHKSNGGLSDARNYGILKAKGEFVTCVDPDDYVDSDYVEYLYTLIKTFNTKMSICQHRVVYKDHCIDYGKEIDSEMLSAEQCIERMLYHDVIDTSAWAKLYHKSLFDNVTYPVGKLFEDIATTYKLMIQSETIAVGYESKYSYCYRNSSIVNNHFSIKKLDLLEMTDKMADEVNSVFPALNRATIRRQVYARFSTLNQMIGVDNVDKQRNDIIDFIKMHSKNVFRNPKTPRRDKVAIILLELSYPLYEFIWTKHKSKEING